MNSNNKNNKKQKSNPSVARLALSEVKIDPYVGKKDIAMNVVCQVLFSLLTVISVVGMTGSCIERSFSIPIVLLSIIAAHIIIYPGMYVMGYKGTRKYVALYMALTVAGIIVFRDKIIEGLLYEVDNYIESFNKYFKSDFYLDFNPEYDKAIAATAFIIVLVVLYTMAMTYIAVCNMSRALFLVITIPWIIVCLIVGERPDVPSFALYAVLFIGIMGTSAIKKRHMPVKVRKMFPLQKCFIDNAVMKMILYSIVVVGIVMAAVAVTLPKDLYKKEELKDRHKSYVDTVKNRTKKTEEKYSLDLNWFDKLLGIESDLGPSDGLDDGENNTLEKLGELFKNEELYDIRDSLQRKWKAESPVFYNKFAHGMLNNYGGEANISTDKIFTLDISNYENSDNMKYLYMRTYTTDQYEDGVWSKINTDTMNDYRQYMDPLYNEAAYYNINEGDSVYDIVIKRAGRNSEMVEMLYNSSDSVYVGGKGDKMKFTIKENNYINQIPMPGSLEKLESVLFVENTDGDKVRSQAMGNYNENSMGTDRIVEDTMVFPLSETEIQGYSSLYDVYTKVPISCYDLTKELANEAQNLQIQPEYFMNDNTEISYYNYYSEVIKAVEFVQNKLSQGYTYTLTPDVDPDEDPVLNFYFKSKEGYCMHFTSAATLMLRAMGVPARYVEGFAISPDEIKKNVSDKHEAKIDVYGTDAHAWVEVYIKGLGWVPQEMTLATTREGRDFHQEAERKQNNESKATKVPSTNKPSTTPSQSVKPSATPSPSASVSASSDTDGAQNDENEGTIIKTILIILAVICIIMGIVAALVYTIQSHKKHMQQKVSTLKGAYRYIVKRLDLYAVGLGVGYGNNDSYEDYAKAFSEETSYLDYDDILKMMEVRSRLKFSLDDINDDDIRVIKDVYNKYMKAQMEEWNKATEFIQIKILGTITYIK